MALMFGLYKSLFFHHSPVSDIATFPLLTLGQGRPMVKRYQDLYFAPIHIDVSHDRYFHAMSIVVPSRLA